MMKKTIVLCLVTLAVWCISIGINAQNSEAFSRHVVKAVSAGNANELQELLYNKIEFVLLGKSGVYSKKQAEMVLVDFFQDYPPLKFEIIHSGEKENASFTIAKYSSGGQSFRFTFLTKETSGKNLIHQLRIEKQDE